MKGPVVILGPPGAGKSTAGARAAAHLGMRFVDLDDVIAADAGASAAGSVFAQEGEPSFRVRELHALERVLDGSDLVVAAGAGVVDTGPARELLARRALCVRMEVAVDVAVARLSNASPRRPWLDVADPRASYIAREVERGRAEKRAALSSGSPRVDGNRERDVVDVVDGNRDRDAVAADLTAVIDGLRPVYAAPLAPDAVMSRLGEGAAALPAGAVVVVDEALAGHAALASLSARDVITAPGGERAKTLAHVEELAEALLARGVTRSDTVVVAVGGGAFLDVAGLAASLVLRGVRWWSVPTTLLAQADAGVGGKTAVNARDGRKNLLGAFHPPERTVVDARFLPTLSEAALRDGRAEMLKHELLAGFPVDDTATSLAVKLSVVRRDPNERGLRAVLNLGHTLAHALEATVPGLSHGTAVLYGLRAMLRLSVAHAGLDPDVARTLDTRVAAVAAGATTRAGAGVGGGAGALPDLAVDPARVAAALRADKKKAGRFVLLRAPGLPVVKDLGALSGQDVTSLLP